MLSEIDQCYIHLNAGYLAFSAGNYAQSKRELAEARTIYHAKPRGVPPRGFWSDAFDEIVRIGGELKIAEKRKKNPKESDYGSPIFPDALVMFSPDINTASDSFSVRGAVYRSPSAARAGREGYFVHDRRSGGTRVFPLLGWETEVYVDGKENPVLHFNAPKKEEKKRSRIREHDAGLIAAREFAEKRRKNPKNIHFDGYDFAIEGGRYKRIPGGDVEKSPLPRKSTARRRASIKTPEKQKYSKEYQLQAWTNARNSLEKGRLALVDFAWSRKPVYIESARLLLRSARWNNVVVNASSLYLPEDKAKIRKEISELARAIKAAESETRSNPMRRNHHLKAGMRASGSVKVLKSLGLQKSGEDLYLVDGRKLRKARK